MACEVALVGGVAPRIGDYQSPANGALGSLAMLNPLLSGHFVRELGSLKRRVGLRYVQPPPFRRLGVTVSASCRWNGKAECASFGPRSNCGTGRGYRLGNGTLACNAAAGAETSTSGEAEAEHEHEQSDGNKHVVHFLQRILALRALPAFVLGLGVMLSLRPGHALANAAGEAFSPQGKGLLASAWAGLAAGCLHTLTGPDHLAALAPLCIGRSRVQSAAVGALWGCGHDAGQIIFGLIFLVLKDKLHIELIRTWASRVVGLTLITIGGVGIYEAQEPVAVLAENAGLQEGGGGESQVRMKNDSKNATTFATGVVYGLQPDALLVILPALALPSRATGAAFLVMFLLGTVLAMGSYTLFISSCSHALQKRLPGITKNLSLGSSIIAISLGLALLASELFGLNIF
ncbi:unnamed protein product [Calypogeia fissa]